MRENGNERLWAHRLRRCFGVRTETQPLLCMSKGEYQQATMDDDETTYILDGRKTHRAKPQRPYLAFIAGSAMSHTVGTWPERYPRGLACLSRAIMRTRHTRSCSAAGSPAVALTAMPTGTP